jgi:predicted NBD/HSP70 family sugar kinase
MRGVRRANLSGVLTVLRSEGRLSRSQLVSATGLTRSAIGGLVAELSDLGLVRQDAATPDGSPGRPSPVVRIDEACVGALAVEITVDELGVAIVGLDGSVVHSLRVPRQGEGASVADAIKDVVSLVGALGVESRDVNGRRLVGIGVAIAGLVDGATNVVVRAPNLDWTNVALGQQLSDALGLQLPLFVANDGDVGALAEARFGAGVGADNMVYVSGEVGIGGGVFVDGRRVAGRSGFAGEIGHMPVNPNGRLCRCGATGCWETEIGEVALLVRAGRNPDGGTRLVTDLVEAAERGEPAATEALAEEARWLGIGIAGLINIFDPEIVVLGGFLGAIVPVIDAQLRARVEARSFQGLCRSVAVVAGALGGDAGLIGAAELAFEPLVGNPLLAG